LLTALVRQHPFFWDTVQLASKHAHWYFENDFRHFFLPPEFDSGHPPTFGMYLAFCWKIFGKSLIVSHFAMLPFLWGMVWFGSKIGHFIAGDRGHWLLLTLFAVDPTLGGQALLVSPDIVLVCFFLMALTAILEKKKWLLLVAGIGLCLVSMRGMITATGLFLFEILRQKPPVWQAGIKHVFNISLPWLPGFLLAFVFLSAHFLYAGWVGHHADSPWAPSFDRVDFQGFIKNVTILIWRLFDYGRVLLWAMLIGFIWRERRRFSQLFQHPVFKNLVLLLCCMLLVLTPTFLLYKGLSGYRYILPVYLAVSMLFVDWTMRYKHAKTLAFIGIFALFSGNFWRYPNTISQGWDATMGHFPFYALRQKALDFFDREKIPLETVGTAFPQIGKLEWHDLSGRQDGFAEKDFAANVFIFYSNIMNDFSDDETALLFSKWQLVERWENYPVEVVIFKNPKPD
jgi:hypothetical protein